MSPAGFMALITHGRIAQAVPQSSVAARGMDATHAARVRLQVRQKASAFYANWVRHDGPGSTTSQKGGANGAP